MSLNDDAWQILFTQLDIVNQVNQHGYFDISSDQINTLSGRQSRLMTKIDFREHLPLLFKQNNLSILAYRNGVYRIARNDPFIDIAPLGDIVPEQIELPEDIISFDPHALTSEKKVLRTAMRCGIIEKVCGEAVFDMNPDLHFSEQFDFTYGGCDYPVSGVQLEIDGVFEGAQRITAIEAKMGFRSNISLRQLVYPHLNLTKIAKGRRVVQTFVMLYEEPLLRFIPIVCIDGVWSADHARERVFQMTPRAKLNLTSIVPDPTATVPVVGTPFPQANRFDTVLSMFGIISGKQTMTKDELASEFDVDPDPRHVDYYFAALRWLGLVTIQDGIISLTPLGKDIARSSHSRRMQRLAQLIFNEPLFQHVLHHPEKPAPPELFNRWNCESHATRVRRLRTVTAWVKYFTAYSEK